MYRVNDNPPPRFPEGRPLSKDEGLWVVVHLRSRREKAFAIEMKEEKVGYYLPLYEKSTRRRDTGKIRKTIKPLFPGYIAVVKERANAKKIRSSDHVANIITVVNQRGFIHELSQIQRILGENVPLEFHNSLIPGDEVRVLWGPLAGLQGPVIKCGKKMKMAVSVEMFNQSILINIDEKNLVKA